MDVVEILPAPHPHRPPLSADLLPSRRPAMHAMHMAERDNRADPTDPFHPDFIPSHPTPSSSLGCHLQFYTTMYVDTHTWTVVLPVEMITPDLMRPGRADSQRDLSG